MPVRDEIFNRPASEWTLEQYTNALKWADWTYEYSDDFGVWQRGHDEFKKLREVQALLDPDMVIWNAHDQLKADKS